MYVADHAYPWEENAFELLGKIGPTAKEAMPILKERGQPMGNFPPRDRQWLSNKR
jgi:hypothetical protein